MASAVRRAVTSRSSTWPRNENDSEILNLTDPLETTLSPWACEGRRPWVSRDREPEDRLAHSSVEDYGGEFSWRVSGDQVTGPTNHSDQQMRHEFEQAAHIVVANHSTTATTNEHRGHLETRRA